MFDFPFFFFISHVPRGTVSFCCDPAGAMNTPLPKHPGGAAHQDERRLSLFQSDARRLQVGKSLPMYMLHTAHSGKSGRAKVERLKLRVTRE
jgi:hypothetical protein